ARLPATPSVGRSDLSCRHAPADPGFHVLFRLRIPDDVRHHGSRVRPGRQHAGEPLQRDAADGDEWDGADATLPLADAAESLRREGHHFEECRVDGPQGDVVRRMIEGARQLRLIVRADADPDAGAAKGRHVCRVEVALPQVHEVAGLLQCELPVIVDDALRTGASTQAPRLADLGSELANRAILDAQLHEADPSGEQTSDPRCAVDDRIDAWQRHERNALPTTGVEGFARSRGSMSPASYAALPAMTACANAPAMAAGSRAWETAVLISTAS